MFSLAVLFGRKDNTSTVSTQSDMYTLTLTHTHTHSLSLSLSLSSQHTEVGRAKGIKKKIGTAMNVACHRSVSTGLHGVPSS